MRKGSHENPVKPKGWHKPKSKLRGPRRARYVPLRRDQ